VANFCPTQNTIILNYHTVFLGAGRGVKFTDQFPSTFWSCFIVIYF
jgi:hypothetical protein